MLASDAPPWVRIDHDGMTCQLRHPWWVRWLVLWVVPVLLGACGVAWLGYPRLASALPSAGLQVAILLSGASVVATGVSVGLVMAVTWWTAPVDLRLRHDHFLITRRFLGRSQARRFDLRHTSVHTPGDRSFVRFVMERPGQALEEVVAVPVAQRSAWLPRALRRATRLAARPAPAGASPSAAEEAAMSALLAAPRRKRG